MIDMGMNGVGWGGSGGIMGVGVKRILGELKK